MVFNAYTDGGNRGGNPGRGSWGYVIYDEHGYEVHRMGGWVTLPSTNNDMEYRAVIELLKWWHASGCSSPLHIYSDSELIVRQITGVYRVSEKMLRYYTEAFRLMHITGSTISWVPREQNTVADSIVNQYHDEHERSLGVVPKSDKKKARKSVTTTSCAAVETK